MAETTRKLVPAFTADGALRAAAKLWFLVAVAGQFAFICFIVVFYGGSTLQGQLESWNRKSLITGYVAGDGTGNMQFAIHVLMAAVITAAGALQLVPQIRARAIRFHRWNGRVYIVMAFLMSLGGLWLVWGRGTYLTLTGAISISLLAVMLMVSAVMTVRYAMARRIAVHQRWALRLFLLVGGVWFQRIGYMAWIILNQGPVGIGKRMDGPFDLVWGFGCYLLPLAVLELYFLAKSRTAGGTAKATMAIALFVLTAVMGIGIVGAYLFMWRPVM